MQFTVLNRDVTAIKELEHGIKEKVKELLQKNQEIGKLNEKLHIEATTDYLTRFYNRRFWDILLQQEFEKTRRNEYQISFLILDIDNFKNINDSYGHTTGDNVLKELSRTGKGVRILPAGGEEMNTLYFFQIHPLKVHLFWQRRLKQRLN